MDSSNYLVAEIAGEASGPTETSLRSAFILISSITVIVLLTLLALDRKGVVLPVIDEVTMTVVR